MTSTTEIRSVVVERDIAFPAEKIWRALTQPHLIEDLDHALNIEVLSQTFSIRFDHDREVAKTLDSLQEILGA